MVFAVLMTAGWVIGLTLGALAHPKIYRAVFGGDEASADFDGRA